MRDVADAAEAKKGIPRHRDVANQLIERISGGVYPVGSLLPTETHLTEIFQVSRHTIREAVRHLQTMGLVMRRQGHGEVQKALGADTTLGADALGKAFSSIDANGDGQISADELTTALAAQKGAPGTEGPHHGRHAHHAHGAPPASSDLAAQVLGAADTDSDGALSVAEIEKALGVSTASGATDALTSAIGKLDANGDGQLSASELSAGIDAFRAAHHRGGAEGQASQAVTA